MVRNLIFGSGASFVVSFSSLVLIARLFSLDFISDVKAVTIYGGWFSLVFTCQVHSAFLFFHNKPGSSKESAKIFTLCFLMASSVLCGVVFHFAFPALYSPVALSRAGLTAFSLLVSFNLLFAVSPAVFTALGISRKLPSLMFMYPLSALVSLLLSFAFHFSVNQYAMITTGLSGLVLFLSEWRRNAVFAISRFASFMSSYDKMFGGYSAKISVSIFFESLGDRVDKVMASRFLSQAVFAKYSVLCFENPIVGVLLNSYGVATVKKFQTGVAGREAEFQSAWETMARIITFITFPISIFIWFNSEWFVSTVFGPRFLDASSVLKVYLLVSLVRYAPFQALLRMEGVVHYNVILSVFFFLAAVSVAGWVLWSGRGWEWMAYSYLSGWLVFNGLAVYFFRKVSRTPFSKIVNLRVWVSRMCQCLLAGAVGKVLSNGNVYSGLFISTLVYLAAVAYFDATVRNLVLGQLRSMKSLAPAKGNRLEDG